jgi:hypothetical protein
MIRKKPFLLLGIFLSLLLLYVGSVNASPSKNPIFATIEQVQQMINSSSLHPKTFKVFDKNDTELGIYVTGTGHNIRIYVESLNKFVDIEYKLISPCSNLYFQSNNCTGTSLMQTGGSETEFIPDVVGGEINEHYTFDLPPYTFFLLNGDIELNRYRQLFV